MCKGGTVLVITNQEPARSCSAPSPTEPMNYENLYNIEMESHSVMILFFVAGVLGNLCYVGKFEFGIVLFDLRDGQTNE